MKTVDNVEKNKKKGSKTKPSQRKGGNYEKPKKSLRKQSRITS